MTITNTRRCLSAKWEADGLSPTEHKELLDMGGYEPSPVDKISAPTKFDAVSSLFYNDNEKGSSLIPLATMITKEGHAVSAGVHYILLVRNYQEASDCITVTGGDIGKGLDVKIPERLTTNLMPFIFNTVNSAIEGNQDPYDKILITPYIAKYIFGCDKKKVKEGKLCVKIGLAIFNITYIQNMLKSYYYFFGKNADMILNVAMGKVAYVNTDKVCMVLMPMNSDVVENRCTYGDECMIFDLNSIPTNPSSACVEIKEEANLTVIHRVNDDYNETVTLLVDKKEMELEYRVYKETTRCGLKLTKEALRSLYEELSKMKLDGTI